MVAPVPGGRAGRPFGPSSQRSPPAERHAAERCRRRDPRKGSPPDLGTVEAAAAGGLSPLAVWWVKLGIWPERIAPGHPEQNGRHERMHLTLKQECCRPPGATLAAQQLRFDAFTQNFNFERPHQALRLRPPAQFYAPSPRPYPSRLEDPTYPACKTVRRVRSNGAIKWQGKLVFLSEALVGEIVGVSETLVGYEVRF